MNIAPTRDTTSTSDSESAAADDASSTAMTNTGSISDAGAVSDSQSEGFQTDCGSDEPSRPFTPSSEGSSIAADDPPHGAFLPMPTPSPAADYNKGSYSFDDEPMDPLDDEILAKIAEYTSGFDPNAYQPPSSPPTSHYFTGGRQTQTVPDEARPLYQSPIPHGINLPIPENPHTPSPFAHSTMPLPTADVSRVHSTQNQFSFVFPENILPSLVPLSEISGSIISDEVAGGAPRLSGRQSVPSTRNAIANEIGGGRNEKR